MVERIKILRFINALAMLSVASFNALDCYVNSRGAERYLLYVAPFFILGLLVLFWKNYKVNAVLYAAAGVIIALTGGNGNFSGAIFLIFSIYIFNTFKTMLALLVLTAISIVSRCVFLDYTIPDTINLFIAYAFSFGVYFVLIHPKSESKPVLSKVDEDTIKIVGYIRDGKKVKEIAELVYLSTDAIYSRLSRARKLYECENTAQLCELFVVLGFLEPKFDKPT